MFSATVPSRARARPTSSARSGMVGQTDQISFGLPITKHMHMGLEGEIHSIGTAGKCVAGQVAEITRERELVEKRDRVRERDRSDAYRRGYLLISVPKLESFFGRKTSPCSRTLWF